MRRLIVALGLSLWSAVSATAQEPPPRIGPFVFDLHMTVPRFPSDDPQLLQSRGLSTGQQLPGTGLGGQAGAHLYFLHVKAITFGIGAEVAAGRSRETPLTSAPKPTTETFATFSPQLSFNFGTGHGWSYLSGGLGTSVWALVPDGSEKGPPDVERLKTLNYGGGARWFVKPHLAFSLDVRIYVMSPGTPYTPPDVTTQRPGGPRTNLLVIGAGISVK